MLRRFLLQVVSYCLYRDKNYLLNRPKVIKCFYYYPNSVSERSAATIKAYEHLHLDMKYKQAVKPTEF